MSKSNAANDSYILRDRTIPSQHTVIDRVRAKEYNEDMYQVLRASSASEAVRVVERA
jgi:hypothetical protein